MLELGLRAPLLLDGGGDYGADMRQLVAEALAGADVANADAGVPIDAVFLGALADTGADRAATVARLRSTRGRDSVLGRYDIDDRGATTLPARGRLRVESGRFVSVS
jgi:hypothetical protein